MPRPSTTYQFDLFPSQCDAKPAQTPQWQALPPETRQSVTKLMINLILDHIDRDRAGQREGADHDA